jgi:hypothetical protein
MRTKVTTSCDMAAPHTPIAILQSHLQALYDVLILTFVIAISLFPGGARTQHTDMWRGTRSCLRDILSERPQRGLPTSPLPSRLSILDAHSCAPRASRASLWLYYGSYGRWVKM